MHPPAADCDYAVGDALQGILTTRRFRCGVYASVACVVLLCVRFSWPDGSAPPDVDSSDGIALPGPQHRERREAARLSPDAEETLRQLLGLMDKAPAPEQSNGRTVARHGRDFESWAIHVADGQPYLDLLVLDADEGVAVYGYSGDDVGEILRMGGVDGQFMTADGGFYEREPDDAGVAESIEELGRSVPPYVGLVDIPLGQQIPLELEQEFLRLVHEVDPVQY